VIAHYYPKSTEVLVNTHQYRIGPPVDPLTDERIAFMLQGEDLQRFAAANRLTAKGVISEKAFLVLNSDTQKFFTPVYSSIYLLNYPTPGLPAATEKVESKVRHSRPIDCLVVPTANKGFYDCGTPFTGHTNQFRIVYVILNNRIVIRTNSMAIVPAPATNTSVIVTHQ
jgi:hypothetical protein